MNPNCRQFIQCQMLAWYDAEKRDMPWRETKDPYAVWLSEIMLQQTRVETVIPYWNRFLVALPTIQSLAQAEENTVLKLWEGLGYYSRARNLQKAARQIMEKHEGKFPSKYEEILALSGIGEYTAGAIYSIVFDGIQPAVDGNVLRIVSRLAVIDAPIRSTKTVQRIRKLARYFMSRERPGDFNQALMEMGGRICLPKNPRCDQCVLQVSCRAKQQNCQSELPCKSAKKAPQLKNVNLLVAKTASGQILMSCTQRPGLYSGMWQLPKVTVVTKSTMVEELLREKVEGAWTDFTKIMEYEHQFSHQIWKITVFQVKLMEWENKHYHLIDDVKTLPIAGAMKKALGLEKQG